MTQIGRLCLLQTFRLLAQGGMHQGEEYALFMTANGIDLNVMFLL